MVLADVAAAEDALAPRTRSARRAFAFSLPQRKELPGRLEAVLDASCAAFAEGWSDPGGTDIARRDLSAEAMFLGRLELIPQEPEALGLLGLMLHTQARRRARRNANGESAPLCEQDPSLWDSQMIDEAAEPLRRGSALAAIGCYRLEGALGSAHVYRRRTASQLARPVVQLFDGLLLLVRLASDRHQSCARCRRDAGSQRRS